MVLKLSLGYTLPSHLFNPHFWKPQAMASPCIDTFVLGDFATNCHVVTVPGAAGDHDPADCWIVDCGFEPAPLLDHIEESGLKPRGIILTHCHSDHVAGIDEAIARFGRMPILAHPLEAMYNQTPELNLSSFVGMPIVVESPTGTLEHGDQFDMNGVTWDVRHAPGHSPGSICLVNMDSDVAIVGDTLFAGSIGRVDFPTSDPEAMARSLSEQLMTLPGSMTIHPGHGPTSTIGRELQDNPFLQSLG